MEKIPFKKTLKEIEDLANEKLAPVQRRHGLKGSYESDKKAAGGVESFYVEQADIDALPENLHEVTKRPGPDEYEDTDPYDGE